MVIIGNGYRVLVGDVRERLKDIASESVQCVCSSPPYWNLRDYGTALWDGGDAACDHVVGEIRTGLGMAALSEQYRGGGKKVSEPKMMTAKEQCPKCGARRIDSQLGLESVPDCCGWATKNPCGECYVCHMVEVFREVRRVLRDDGVCLLNLGDSYATTKEGNTNGTYGAVKQKAGVNDNTTKRTIPPGLKPKDLVGIPWRVALALQADGWWLRSVICWAKKSPMPESVTDRPTNSWEPIFLLAKSATYFWDAEAVKEKSDSEGKPMGFTSQQADGIGVKPSGNQLPENYNKPRGATRNLRNVWHLGPAPFSEAHFATFPPEIPRRAILAGTSAMGCCATCRAPRERVVERTPIKRERPNEYTKRTGEDGTGNSCANDVAGVDVKTIGWRPTCDCNAETIPCLVLDPFSGSGTTGMVATELGREYLGCELNPAYAEMSRRRITSWKRRDADKQLEPLPGQRSLFGDE